MVFADLDEHDTSYDCCGGNSNGIIDIMLMRAQLQCDRVVRVT